MVGQWLDIGHTLVHEESNMIIELSKLETWKLLDQFEGLEEEVCLGSSQSVLRPIGPGLIFVLTVEQWGFVGCRIRIDLISAR